MLIATNKSMMNYVDQLTKLRKPAANGRNQSN